MIAAGNSGDSLVLTRYNADGSLDNSFGISGKTITSLGYSIHATYSIHVLSDDKIILHGSIEGSIYKDIILRYNANGVLDTNFGNNGYIIDNSANNRFCYNLAMQSDNKMLTVGSYDIPSISRQKIAVVRYNSNGNLDTSFGLNGVVETSVDSLHNIAQFVTIQSDGKIIVAGDTNGAGNHFMFLIRLNSDGSLDNTFDTDGKLIIPINANINGLKIQPDGKILLLINSNPVSYEEVGLIRLNINGSLDTTFDSDGVVSTMIGTGNTLPDSLDLQANGKIVVSGAVYNGNYYDILIARYNINGSLDTSFDSDGIVTTSINTNDSTAASIKIQNDGKIVAAGYSGDGTKINFAIARYNNSTLASTNFTTNTISVNIYPNPATNLIKISAKNNIKDIAIYTIEGRLVQTIPADRTEVILNVSGFAKGIYVFKIKINDGIATERVVVE